MDTKIVNEITIEETEHLSIDLLDEIDLELLNEIDQISSNLTLEEINKLIEVLEH